MVIFHVTWFTQYASVQMVAKESICSAHFISLQTKNNRSASAVTMENTDNSRREAIMLTAANHHLEILAKRNGTQRRTNPWCMHCTYCSMPKNMSLDEATSNSERIKPVALAIIKLHLSEELVSYESVNQKIPLNNIYFKIS